MYGVPTMKLSKKVSNMFCSSKVIFCFQSIKVVARLLIFTGALFQFSLLKWLAASLILLDGKSVFHLNRGSHLHQWKRAQKIHWTNHKSNPGSQCEARENVCFFFRLVEKVLRDLLAIQQKWWWKTKANGTRVTPLFTPWLAWQCYLRWQICLFLVCVYLICEWKLPFDYILLELVRFAFHRLCNVVWTC